MLFEFFKNQVEREKESPAAPATFLITLTHKKSMKKLYYTNSIIRKNLVEMTRRMECEE